MIALFCLSNVTRYALRSRLDRPRFAAEGAAHFRYTEVIARGGMVPSIDVKAQYPEGLNVYRETSIGMEYLYGWMYRLIPFGKPDLAAFVRFFTAFFFSLSIVPLALLAVRLWGTYGAGAVTAALFAVVLPLTSRSNGFELIRENVTLPLLIFHIYFFFSSFTSKGWLRPVLSGVFCALALVTWQGTQFYLIPFLLFLVIARIIGMANGVERRAVRVLIACIAISGAAVPFLRGGGFLLSIPVGLSAAWLAADFAVERVRGKKKAGEIGTGDGGPGGAWMGLPIGVLLGTAAAAAACACVIVPGLVLKGHFASYSHLFGLVLYKLRYLEKPIDPGLLPFDVRAFWVGPFLSPDPRHLFVFSLPVILLLPGPVDRLVRRMRTGDLPATFAVSFLLVFFFLFLLMQRMLPFFGFIAVLAVGGNAAGSGGGRESRWLYRVSAVLVAVVFTLSLLQDVAWEGRGDIWRRLSKKLGIRSREKFVVFPVSRDPEGEMLSWIRKSTEPDAVIMTLHYLSPQVLTYTGRATNLNDFFEAPRLRAKAGRLLGKLYSGEGSLLEFCMEQSADYLAVSIAVGCDPTKESPLYQAGLMNMPPGCAAYRLVFEPEKLRGFELVYENEMYRVFRVGRPFTVRVWPRSPLFYERELLWHNDGDIRAFYHSVMRIYALTSRGRMLVRSGSEREGERRLVEALRAFYFYPAWKALDGLYVRRGRVEERETLADYAYRHDPNRNDVCIALARSRLDLDRSGGVRELLNRCLSLHSTVAQRSEIRELYHRLENMERSAVGE